LVTVLMADIVGFTSLSERADPEHVKNLVDRCFQRLVADVVAFGGHLDKIVGDQLVAQFGAPIAHEDDAERAVRCALQMQSTLNSFTVETGSRFDLRIGINTGEVLVGALRAGGDATVMGDVVNTASRLQTSAQPGQVVVGPITYEATLACVRFEALGALTVKNRLEPIEAWIAIEATAPPGRRRRRLKRAALVGRDAELGLLRHTFRIAMRGRAHLIEIYGEAGVGKSRLAMEFAHEARDTQGALVIGGQCVPYGEANVWGPLAEAVRAACGFERDTPLLAIRDKVTAAVAYAIDLPVGHSELDRVVDGLLFLTDAFTREGVDPTRARDEARRAVGRFFEGHATRRPVVLVMSDVHWADAELRDALDRLLVKLRSLSFILVATARPDFAGEWGSPPGRHNHIVLHLEGLDSEASADLVRELLGDDVDDDLVAFLLERSGGNPFFVEELVALALDNTGDGEIDLTSDAVRSLPATLHGLVAARLDTLNAEERSVLEDFAVVGASGSTADALGLGDRADGERIARALADRDLIELQDGEYHFRSELVREVAYGTLTRGERARRHGILAQRLQEAGGDARDETAAFHLAAAADLVADLGTVAGIPADVRDRALDALLKSAVRAETVEHHERAGKLWDRILQIAEPRDAKRVWPARLGRARVLDAFRELDAARDDALCVLEEARTAEDLATVADALLVLGRIEADARSYDDAERYYGEALTAARALQNESNAAEALRGLGMTRLFQGEDVEAERLSSDALAAFRSAGDRRGEAWALQNLAWIAFARGATTRAEERLNESAEAFAEIGDWGGVGWALGLLAFVRYNQGRLDEAEELARQIGNEMDTGDRWAIGMMEVLLADIALWRGRSEECVQRGRDAIELFRGMGDDWAEVQASAPVVRALTKLGRFGEAMELIDAMTPAVSALADPGMRGIGPAALAAMHLERGDAEEALSELSRLAHEPRGSAFDADLAGLHGLALLQGGRVDEALAIVGPAYAAAENDGARTALGGLLALIHVANRDPEAALALGREVSHLRGGTYMDRLLLHWATGYAFAQLGAATDAVAALDEAHAIAFATDARVDRAIASLARATAFEHLGIAAAHEARNEASLQLHSLGIDASGWNHLFRRALEPVTESADS
jgi:class 3 adenylate cyclase/tetratricopeptide (TPR) repeat protein